MSVPVPGGQEGMLGWEDHGWKLLLPGKSGCGVLGGMHKQLRRINALWKQSLERVSESCAGGALAAVLLPPQAARLGDVLKVVVQEGRDGFSLFLRGILAAWVLLNRCQHELGL